jgi:hypothetical protein
VLFLKRVHEAVEFALPNVRLVVIAGCPKAGDGALDLRRLLVVRVLDEKLPPLIRLGAAFRLFGLGAALVECFKSTAENFCFLAMTVGTLTVSLSPRWGSWSTLEP